MTFARGDSRKLSYGVLDGTLFPSGGGYELDGTKQRSEENQPLTRLGNSMLKAVHLSPINRISRLPQGAHKFLPDGLGRQSPDIFHRDDFGLDG